MKEIEYDTPIEVTRDQYYRIIGSLSGIVAHRTDKGRYYVKLWMMRYKDTLLRMIID